jgi:hypothetical protein
MGTQYSSDIHFKDIAKAGCKDRTDKKHSRLARDASNLGTELLVGGGLIGRDADNLIVHDADLIPDGEFSGQGRGMRMMLRCRTVKFGPKVRRPGGAMERGIASLPRCRTRGRIFPRRPHTGQPGAETFSIRTCLLTDDGCMLSGVSTSRRTAIVNATFSAHSEPISLGVTGHHKRGALVMNFAGTSVSPRTSRTEKELRPVVPKRGCSELEFYVGRMPVKLNSEGGTFGEL